MEIIEACDGFDALISRRLGSGTGVGSSSRRLLESYIALRNMNMNQEEVSSSRITFMQVSAVL